ncbi:MAG TPA: DNA polymerase III subunit beta [Acidimicrobiales bacterium]|nr:DNA polymerase III subunit beta [Acidimicrobiales bacterium]
MRFRADRDTLLEALVTASRATAGRSSLAGVAPGLQLSLRASNLEIVGSDPDLVIEVRLQVAGESDGTVLVPTRLVTDIVRSFDSGAVAVAGVDEEVRFSAGRAEFVVRVAAGAEITRLGSPENSGIELPAATFAEGLRQVVRAALTDDSRAPQLTAVQMKATEKGLRLIATDSYRLAFRDFEGMSALEDGSQVLVPARALAEVQRLVGQASESDEDRITFRHSDLDAVFELGDVRITTRLVRGQFPDVDRLVPPSYAYHLTVPREDFATALRRVRLLVRDSKDITTPVRLSFRGHGVELQVLTPESGRAVEELEGDFDGDEVMIAFNPGYLLDGVEALRSDVLVLELNDPGKPALVRGEGEDEYRYLLMPVKVA